MGEALRARLKQWLASGEARLQPLTFPQRELWETSPVPPSDPANHICSFFEVRGPVTFEECRSAVAKVVERQEAMRTSFLPGNERPLQMIRATGEPALRYRELSPEEARPEALLAVMEEGFREPFDFVRGPLYRLEMLRRGPDDYLIAFTIHHAVADGWTLGVFIEDLCGAYIMGLRESGKSVSDVPGIRASMPLVPLTHSEWGAAERGRWTPAELDRHVAYWKDRLSGSRLLWDARRAPGSDLEPLEKWVTELPAELTRAARQLARRSGSTLFSALLASFQVSLHRHTGVGDLTVGTPVANRNGVSVRETMGYFSGVVPLRGHVDPDCPFEDHLRSVHQATMDDFGYAMPFAELVKALGEQSVEGRHTVFDTRFALQNHPVPDVVLPGISTRLRTCSTGTARFDLGCEMTEEGEGLEVVWLFRPSMIPEEEVRELDQVFREVLAAVCRQPDTRPRTMFV